MNSDRVLAHHYGFTDEELDFIINYDGKKIAVEIKSFINTSSIADFHLAIGQFINYRVALKAADPERQLFLAVPESAYNTFFQKEFPRMVIEQYQLELFVYDVENEVIVLWQT